MRCFILALIAHALSAQSPMQPAVPFQRKPLLTYVQGPGPGFGAGNDHFADFNGDGLIDRVSSGYLGLYWTPGRGNGQFAPHVFYAARTSGAYCDIADVDRDGDLDAILTPVYAEPCRMMLNDGRAGFTDGSSLTFPAGPPVGPFNFGRFADIDGDGDSDLVVGPNRLRSYLNDGRGHFVEDQNSMPILTQATVDVAFADFDGDGDLDFVTANGGYFPPEPNYIFWNDGRGRLPSYAMLPGSLISSFVVEAADFDGDGDVDLIFNGSRAPSVLLRNDGFGRFADISSRLSRDPQPYVGQYACAVGDIDQDGDIDIVRGAGRTLLLDVNRGDGTFESKSPEHIWGGETLHYINQDGIYLVDTDQDGDLDLWLGQGGITEIYWGTVTQLRSATYAALGTTIPLYMFGFEGFSVLMLSAAELNVPVHTPLGLLWLDPAASVIDPLPIMVPRNGIGVRQFQVPNNPSLRNRTLIMQGMHVAPSRAWSRLTNRARLTFF